MTVYREDSIRDTKGTGTVEDPFVCNLVSCHMVASALYCLIQIMILKKLNENRSIG